MSIKERKQREKEALRQRILEAAARLLAEEGYEKVSIRKIAEAVEYSPRTIYLYYRDKRELMEAVVEAGFQRTLAQRPLPQAPESSDPILLLKQRLKTHIENALTAPAFYRAVVFLILERNFTPGPAQEEIMAEMREHLALALPAERRSEEEVETLSHILPAALRGFTLSLINKQKTIDKTEIDAITERFIRFVMDGLNLKEEP